MAQNKAAVEVKQEGDFKIKSKPKKMKDLGSKSKNEITKVDLSKPVADEVKSNVIKVDLTKPKTDAVQEHKTEELPVDGTPGDSKKMDEGTRVSDTKEEPVAEVEVQTPIEEVIEEIGESTPEKIEDIQEETKEPTVELPKLPENVDKLLKFMDETGGTVEDYVKLNKDYSKLDDDNLLHEYYKQTKPHLSQDEINFLIEDKFLVDEDIDEQRDIRRKKLAYKEEVAYAKKDLESLKSKYYADIKQRPGVTQEQQKATDFFNRYNKQQETIKQSQEAFQKNTNDLFNTEFKGFDYSVGDKKFRYKVQNPSNVAKSQSDINNFVNKFLDKKGNISDTKGYHKALYAAMNADQLAGHFYEQGKADGVKNLVKQSKNPTTDKPRQVAGGEMFVDGLKVRAISGTDSSKLRIKRKINN